MAVLFALLAPLLFGVGGAAIDYARYATFRVSLQAAADNAAIIGARQLTLASGLPVAEQVTRDAATRGAADAGATGVSATAAGDSSAVSMTATITHTWNPTLLTALYRSPMTVTVTAVAQALGSGNICVVGLGDVGSVVVTRDTAKIRGPDCGVFANSTDPFALRALNSSRIASPRICTSGGYDGAAGNFDATPIEDCPPIDDPLVGRAPPTVGACDAEPYTFGAGDVATMNAGVYCNGIEISGDAQITFSPGVYIIDNSHMVIRDTATATGADVGFYFAGDDAGLTISDAASVQLSGPLAGPMAGVLIWREAAALNTNRFEITSPNVSHLVGTIYLPDAIFAANVAGGAVAASSAYTAILAKEVRVSSGSDVVLNSNYAATAVPAPDGLAGFNQQIYLRR